MLEVALISTSTGDSVKIMSNADSSFQRSHEKHRRADHDYPQANNHTHHHGDKRRHSIGQELNSSKKRSLERGVASNSSSRPHPRTDVKETYSTHNSTPSRSVDRKRRKVSEEGEGKEEEVWTEHKSSSGKVYYYNKHLDKSQWEKPEKGILKRSKSNQQPVTVSGGKGSHSSVKSVKRDSSHHHGNHHLAAGGKHSHTESTNRNAASTGSSSHSNRKLGDSSPSTPLGTNSAPILSPTMPLTPIMTSVNKGLTRNEYLAPESPLMSSTQHHAHSLYVGGPITPLTPNYNKNAGMDARISHLSQYSQVYAHSPGTTPLHMMPSSPVATQLVNNFSFRQQQATPLSTVSQRFQTPMSKLGRWGVGGAPPGEEKFPDPESLQMLPHLPNCSNGMLSKVLADRMWTGQFDPIQKQADLAHLEAVSRLTVDHSYHCGQLARGLLSLECGRIKEVSRSVRLSDLKKIREEIEKR